MSHDVGRDPPNLGFGGVAVLLIAWTPPSRSVSRCA
jgi:hypothetical protein